MPSAHVAVREPGAGPLTGASSGVHPPYPSGERGCPVCRPRRSAPGAGRTPRSGLCSSGARIRIDTTFHFAANPRLLRQVEQAHSPDHQARASCQHRRKTPLRSLTTSPPGGRRHEWPVRLTRLFPARTPQTDTTLRAIFDNRTVFTAKARRYPVMSALVVKIPTTWSPESVTLTQVSGVVPRASKAASSAALACTVGLSSPTSSSRGVDGQRARRGSAQPRPFPRVALDGLTAGSCSDSDC